jgi:uncharacterized LabA/DUF88 family protein
MPGSWTTPGRAAARAIASVRVAFRAFEHVGTQVAQVFAAQWLAYVLPYRRFADTLASASARLRAGADRYSFTVGDFHLLLLAGLPGAPKVLISAHTAHTAWHCSVNSHIPSLTAALRCEAAKMACLILVDNSNVFIEGQKFSARHKGIFRTAIDTRDPQDPSWRIDFGRLLTFLAEGRPITAAILVGSRPPKNDSVWAAAEANGFNVIVHDRSYSGQEKAVDTEIVARGTEIICDQSQPGIVVLASGDRDFIPLVHVAQRRNWTVEMCSFSNAFNPSGQMAMTVNRVRQLDSIFEKIGGYEFTWPIPPNSD